MYDDGGRLIVRDDESEVNPMPTFKSLAALESHIKKCIDNALQDEVLDVVKEYEQQAIDGTVYAAYSPKKYSRRMDGGGLRSEGNMQGVVGGGVLTVTNTTPVTGGPGNLPMIIEGGVGGRSEAYAMSRPFTQDTVAYLAGDDAHTKALKAGLESQGIECV